MIKHLKIKFMILIEITTKNDKYYLFKYTHLLCQIFSRQLGAIR